MYYYKRQVWTLTLVHPFGARAVLMWSALHDEDECAESGGIGLRRESMRDASERSELSSRSSPAPPTHAASVLADTAACLTAAAGTFLNSSSVISSSAARGWASSREGPSTLLNSPSLTKSSSARGWAPSDQSTVPSSTPSNPAAAPPRDDAAAAAPLTLSCLSHLSCVIRCSTRRCISRFISLATSGELWLIVVFGVLVISALGYEIFRSASEHQCVHPSPEPPPHARAGLRLMLMRHAQSENNALPYRKGPLGARDPALSREGEREAMAAREALAHVRVDLVLSSQLLRAISTAAIVFCEQQVNVSVPPPVSPPPTPPLPP